jgi:hypothetical protein
MSRSDDEIRADLARVASPYYCSGGPIADRLADDVPALLERAQRAERRADRLRAFVSSQAITARALGAFDWERRMLDTLHADDAAAEGWGQA